MKHVSKHHICTENATKSSSKAAALKGTATPKWQKEHPVSPLWSWSPAQNQSLTSLQAKHCSKGIGELTWNGQFKNKYFNEIINTVQFNQRTPFLPLIPGLILKEITIWSPRCTTNVGGINTVSKECPLVWYTVVIIRNDEMEEMNGISKA